MKGLLSYSRILSPLEVHDGTVPQKKKLVVLDVKQKRVRNSRRKKRSRNKKRGRSLKVIKGAKAYVPVEEDPLDVAERTSEKASLLDSASRLARKIARGVRIITRKFHVRKAYFRKKERKAKMKEKKKQLEKVKLAKQMETASWKAKKFAKELAKVQKEIEIADKIDSE
ncbi:hypothetical protein TrRE_jg4197, partial [Triparma retinervis]